MTIQPIKSNIIIIGVNDLTKRLIDMVELENKYTIVGLIDMNEPKSKGHVTTEYPIYLGISEFFILMQQNGVNHGIMGIQDVAIKKNSIKKVAIACNAFQFINLIHPSAVLGKNVLLGMGNIIGAKVIMNNDSKLGDFCIIKDRVSIGHESSIKNYVSIETNATLGGNITIGEGSYIGMSSNIINDIAIAENCYIQENALVLHNIPNNSRVSGIPAKIIHSY